MTTEIAIRQDEVQRNLDFLTDLLLSRSDTTTSVAPMVQAMSKPAPMMWTLARVAALLLPYYDKQTPQGVREIEAEDWAEALKEYPQWAVERACRWWKSADNPKRARRPVEGDIAARIRKEMEPVRVAQMRLDAGKPLGLKHTEPEILDPVISKERAAQVMEEVGFKGFGGAA